MIALVSPEFGQTVAQALCAQGAVQAILTEIRGAQEGELDSF
jgi:hypothetical protein